MRIAIRRIGNSKGIIIPAPLLAQLGLETEAEAEATVEDGALVVRAAAKRARAGWNEASKAIAASGDDEPVLPEFSNKSDAEIEW
jgi:antitoxin MazE